MLAFFVLVAIFAPWLAPYDPHDSDFDRRLPPPGARWLGTTATGEDVFSQLVVDFARKHGARTMVKGLRVIADFEWEFQMNRLNHLLAPEVETMYVMSSPEYAFVSSSGVKEIASFGGRVESLVTPAVAERFRELYPNGRPGAPLSPQD